MALGGDGGDELFAGYDPFHALKAASWYKRLTPRPLHAALRLLAARLPVSQNSMTLGFKINRTLQGLDHKDKFWSPTWIGPLSLQELEDFFNEPMDPETVYSEAIEEWDNCRQANIVDRTLQFFTRLYLTHAVLNKVDRASMLHSLEVRTPFLDIDMVDFVRKIPHQYKYRHGTTKYILKKALAPELPQAILKRKKKGFGVPVGQWFYDGVLTFSDTEVGNLNGARRLADHRAGKADHRLFLWNFWVLQKFMQRMSP